MKGLKFGLPAHLLDAIRLIALAWSNITRATIINCWIKANIFGYNTPLSLELAELTVKVQPSHKIQAARKIKLEMKAKLSALMHMIEKPSLIVLLGELLMLLRQ